MKERKVFKTSNVLIVNYLISKGCTFNEDAIEVIEYNGREKYSFGFYVDDIHFRGAMNEVNTFRDKGEKPTFPEETTENQLTWGEAQDIRYDALRRRGLVK